MYPPRQSTNFLHLKTQIAQGPRAWVAAEFVHQGHLAQWREQEAVDEQRALIARLGAGQDAKVAERLYELTWLLAEAALVRGDQERADELLEQGLAHLRLARHRTFFAGWLARLAAIRGETSQAQKWLAQGTVNTDDLVAHSSLAIGSALTAMQCGAWEDVGAAIGKPGEQLLLHPSDLGMGLLLRGKYAEATGGLDMAVAQVYQQIERYGPALMGALVMGLRALDQPMNRGFPARLRRAQEGRLKRVTLWNIFVSFGFSLFYGIGGGTIMFQSWWGETNWWSFCLGALGPMVSGFLVITGIGRIWQYFTALDKLDATVTTVKMGDDETAQSAYIQIEGLSEPVHVLVSRRNKVPLQPGDLVLASRHKDGVAGYVLWR